MCIQFIFRVYDLQFYFENKNMYSTVYTLKENKDN